MFDFIISGIFGYLLGSIPFGLLLSKFFAGTDIRKIGSGNIGATNVLRTGKKHLAILTILLDGGKAGIAALICASLFNSPLMGLVAGTAGVIGHNFPIWLDFKGGKGVAATIGMMLATCPWIGVCFIGTWLMTAIISKYSSLAALVAMGLTPVYALIFGNWTVFGFYTFLSLLAFWRHRENIKRLLNGTESKIKLKK